MCVVICTYIWYNGLYFFFSLPHACHFPQVISSPYSVCEFVVNHYFGTTIWKGYRVCRTNPVLRTRTVSFCFVSFCAHQSLALSQVVISLHPLLANRPFWSCAVIQCRFCFANFHPSCVSIVQIMYFSCLFWWECPTEKKTLLNSYFSKLWNRILGLIIVHDLFSVKYSNFAKLLEEQWSMSAFLVWLTHCILQTRNNLLCVVQIVSVMLFMEFEWISRQSDY